MTEEEKIADLKANFDYVLEGKDLEIKELKETDEYIIKTLESKVEKLQEDLRNKRISIKNKKAEIKQLGERCNQLLKDKGDLTDKNKELEQQIEKMKCCGNCKYSNQESAYSIVCKVGGVDKTEYINIDDNQVCDKWELKEND